MGGVKRSGGLWVEGRGGQHHEREEETIKKRAWRGEKHDRKQPKRDEEEEGRRET